MKHSEIKYDQSNIESVFQKLISNWPELTDFYNNEIQCNLNDPGNRLVYVDIGRISHFIVEKKRSEQTENFDLFFENIEDILIHGTPYVTTLISIGLFEGIQNIGGSDIDYYRSFNQWLKPHSLKAWREVIDFWEGNDWKKTPESKKILNKKK